MGGGSSLTRGGHGGGDRLDRADVDIRKLLAGHYARRRKAARRKSAGHSGGGNGGAAIAPIDVGGGGGRVGGGGSGMGVGLATPAEGRGIAGGSGNSSLYSPPGGLRPGTVPPGGASIKSVGADRNDHWSDRGGRGGDAAGRVRPRTGASSAGATAATSLVDASSSGGGYSHGGNGGGGRDPPAASSATSAAAVAAAVAAVAASGVPDRRAHPSTSPASSASAVAASRRSHNTGRPGGWTLASGGGEMDARSTAPRRLPSSDSRYAALRARVMDGWGA
ncbi:hypothetical protein MMPV_008192 [Pyropia vietnamensis]